MPNIDPKVAFYLGLVLCVISVIANGGSTILEGTMPAGTIVILVAWCKAINGIGTAVMTYIAGANMTTAGRIASVQSVPITTRAASLANDNDVQHVLLKSQAAADAIPSDKVIGPDDVKKAA